MSNGNMRVVPDSQTGRRYNIAVCIVMRIWQCRTLLRQNCLGERVVGSSMGVVVELTPNIVAKMLTPNILHKWVQLEIIFDH